MELMHVEKVDFETALGVLKKALISRHLVVILGECRVDYEGRGASRLEPGERLVVIKGDGSVLVHRPSGYSPVNWQPPGSIVEVTSRQGLGLIIHVVREKPREFLTIVFTRIDTLISAKMTDIGEFTMYLGENEIRDILVENPELIEKGLRIIGVEKQIGDGYVDIYAEDSEGRRVLIELKRITATREAVLQLYRYIERYRNEYNQIPRGIIIAPAFSPSALEAITRLGLEYKSIDLKQLWRYFKKKREKKTTLLDYRGE